MFDIVTSNYCTPEWANTFIKSLEKTIGNKDRRIYMVDNSPEPQRGQLIQLMEKSPLNIIPVFYEGRKSKIPAHYLLGLRTSESKFCCLCDIDIVFLQKDWDLYIEQKMREKYSLIAACNLYVHGAEVVFCLCEREIVLESRLAHAGQHWDESFVWDDSLMEERKEFVWDNVKYTQDKAEHAYLTYYHLMHKRHFYGFRNSITFPHLHCGYVLLDESDKELIYHHTMVRLSNIRWKGPRDGDEAMIRICNHIDDSKQSNDFLEYYIDQVWPASLADYLRSIKPKPKPKPKGIKTGPGYTMPAATAKGVKTGPGYTTPKGIKTGPGYTITAATAIKTGPGYTIPAATPKSNRRY